MVSTVCSAPRPRRRAALASLVALFAWEIFPAAPPASSPELESPETFFEKKIRPVLVEHCYKCHASTSKRLKGGLELDTRAGVLKGGDSGPAIVPGKPKESLLLKALRYDDEDLQMPPKGKLPESVIADFALWIQQGAPDPRVAKPAAGKATPDPIDLEKAREFWAFQPPREPALPDVKDREWCRSPLDRFVLARLEAAGLEPAPAADKRTLIRRVTFDLTGLPPTSAEVDAFLSDDTPDAYSRVIERLLASPSYGERWGRHWLDVARYADSNGVDENLAYVNAFRYRDYVVDAFNRDLPFDRFLHEQLAGDLLPAGPDEPEERRLSRLIATGFLSIGPKMLACDDGRKMELDIVDEQIDTVSRSFMAMTLACARCHDHKFDPFPSRDYYALAGIFKSTKTMENFKVVAEWHEHDVSTAAQARQAAEHEEKLKRIERQLAERTRSAEEAFLSAERGKAGRYFRAAARIVRRAGPAVPDGTYSIGADIAAEDLEGRGVIVEAEKFQRGDLTVETTNYGEGIGVLLHAGHVEYDVELPTAGAYQLELRYAAQESRPVVLSINGRTVKDDAAREVTGGWHPQHQRWHLEGVFAFKGGANIVRVERSAAVPHLDKILIVRLPADAPPAEAGGETAGTDSKKVAAPKVTDVAADRELNAELLRQWIQFLKEARRAPEGIWRELFAEGGAAGARDGVEEVDAPLIDSYAERFDAANTAWMTLLARKVGDTVQQLPDSGLEKYRAVLYAEKGPFRAPKDAKRFFTAEAKTAIDTLGSEKEKLEKSRPSLPRAMGVRDGKIEDLAVHIRGSYLTLGEEAPRGFPRVLAGEDREPLDPASSGRLALARWMTEPDHPLTARVAVNRIWLWHFGEGIVRTPDNFGHLGGAPTHPELLDWLALRFVDSGWSIKEMHRLILHSATYRMSSTFDPAAYEKDPENRLWWRFERRRLSAEEIRDAILVFGGQLDRTMRGQLLPNKSRDYVTGTGSKEGTYDFDRRSIYLPVLRSAVYQMFQTFDFADPSVLSGQRASTTVAPQALFMMNGKLVIDAARRRAERLLERGDLDDPARVRQLYVRAFGRPPTSEEVARGRDFVARYETVLTEAAKGDENIAERRIRAWQGLCRVLLAANEFVYVE